MEKNKINIDSNTLNSLPLPVIIYNENEILFLNNEAKKFFKIKNLNKKLNIFHFFPPKSIHYNFIPKHIKNKDF